MSSLEALKKNGTISPFTCPHCREEIPATEEPHWGNCPHCHEWIYLTPQGIFEKKATEDKTEYMLYLPNGGKVQLFHHQIKKMIQKRRITPYDKISDDGITFYSIMDDETFGSLFQDSTLHVQRYCAVHPQRVATRTCSQCLRGYCEECGEKKNLQGKTVIICPACWASLEKADLKWLEKPFYRDIKRVLTYAIRDGAWMTTAGVAILIWIGGLLPPISLIIYFIALAFIVHIIQSSANGHKSLTLPTITHPWDLMGKGLAAFLVFIILFVPILLVNVFILLPTFIQGGGKNLIPFILLNVPIVSVAFFYYPMALGLVAVWENPWLAFRVDLVFRQAFLILKDYLAVLAVFFLFFALERMASYFLPFIPFAGKMVAIFLHGYLTITQAHILGWTLYLNEEKLGWK